VDSSILTSIGNGIQDNEDLAVGSGGLSSGRDRRINEATLPRDFDEVDVGQLAQKFESNLPPYLPDLRHPLSRSGSPRTAKLSTVSSRCTLLISTIIDPHWIGALLNVISSVV